MNKNLFDTIKLLIYKESQTLFVDTNKNDEVFQNPLLFAYFNNKKYDFFDSDQLKNILLEDEVFTKIQSTKVKLLNLKHPVLNGTFTKNEKPIAYEKIEISEKINAFFMTELIAAFGYIKDNATEHFQLIEDHCKAICLFNTPPENTNSFATINAHGMAFLNVYQWQDYDEVFFVDDISHQTGHIIMNSFWFNRKEHFVIDENQGIKDIVKDPKEYRSFYILFHALYTYYATIFSLENCIDNNAFNKSQQIEAKGRIVFYLKKYVSDLMKFELVCKHYKGIDNVINNDSQDIYTKIKNKFKASYQRWINEFNTYSFKNQPYNFTFPIFIKDNPNINS